MGQTTIEPATARDKPRPGPTAAVAQPDPPPQRRMRLPRWLFILTVALVVAACLGTAIFAVLRLQSTSARLHKANAAIAQRDSVASAARKMALDLTSYDFHNLDANFNAVLAESAPPFKDDYNKTAGTLKALIQQYQSSASGEVLEEAVQSADDHNAVVLLFVNQSVSNKSTPTPRVSTLRMKLTLTRPGDGPWLMSRVDLR